MSVLSAPQPNMAVKYVHASDMLSLRNNAQLHMMKNVVMRPRKSPARHLSKRTAFSNMIRTKNISPQHRNV